MRTPSFYRVAAVATALALAVPVEANATPTARSSHSTYSRARQRVALGAHRGAHVVTGHRTNAPGVEARTVEIQPGANLGPDLRDLQFRGTGGGLEVVADAHHFIPVDGGRLQVRVPDHEGAHASWPVVGGLVRLATGGYAPIVRGELEMARRGNGWILAGGSLIPAPSDAGGASESARDTLPSATSVQAVVPDAPVDPAARGNNHTAGPVMLPSRSLAALDQLLALAPQGSRDAIRLASAIEVTIHNAESTNPSVYATPIIGRTVVLLIDTSYSMRDRDPDSTDATIDPSSPPSKLDVAKAEIVRMLSALPPSTQVNIVAFSSGTTTLWTSPRSIDDTALEQAIHWVAALQPGDETEPLPALRAADAMHPDQIVFVSDGRPTDRDDDDRALLALADTVAVHGARLDIVGIGTDQDAAFIDAVAAHGRGAAHHR